MVNTYSTRLLLSYKGHVEPGTNLVQATLCYELVRKWPTGIYAMQKSWFNNDLRVVDHDLRLPELPGRQVQWQTVQGGTQPKQPQEPHKLGPRSAFLLNTAMQEDLPEPGKLSRKHV